MRVVVLSVLLFSAFTFAGYSNASARTWYVDPYGTGDAPTIRAGIDSATAGDTVLVACGTYHEWLVYVKSGICLRSASGLPECVTVDVEGWWPSWPVLICLGVDSTATIEGLTFKGGWCNQPPGYMGGGALYCDYSSPRVLNCDFLENSTPMLGGAIHCHESSPTFVNCNFGRNSAGGGAGGAIYCTGGSIKLIGCAFLENEAYNGGALYCEGFSSCAITSCTFSENSASNEGGGIRWSGDGSLTLTNTIIAFSTEGEAVYVYGSSVPTVTCSNLFGNAGGDWVGTLTGLGILNGNFSSDPQFCDTLSNNYYLCQSSPCAPDNSPSDCGQIGALPVGCGPTATESTSWGRIKAMFR